MPVELHDATIELQNRRAEIEKRSDDMHIDSQEMKEREDAAKAYFSEDEQHFVDYCMDCIKQSVEANKEIRRIQSACWNVYNELEPSSYANKEEWQARTVVPKPFGTVQFGAAAVKKAFSPNFLSIQNAKDKASEEFWKKTMTHELNETHAHFPLAFKDATVMGLAIGVSMEMIPRWISGKGLEYSLIEPWKISRDPDAISRDPQSGMFWIHQEWLDYFVLKKGEESERYFDVARVKDMGDVDEMNPFMSKEAIAARKNTIWQRSDFRSLHLASEFWGIVLDSKGDMLLPRATYTVCGGRVIQQPKVPIYATLRWPGVSFSPFPDLLRAGGRGLLEGILSIWEAMNNLECLSEDYMKWVVDPPTEINTDALVDPNDADIYPGMKFRTKDTMSGQQVVRVVQRRSRINDTLAQSQHQDQMFQRGSMVNDSVQGLPGYRKDITFRESSMNLDQALGVFGLIGEDVECGAIDAIRAGAEVVDAHAGYNDLREIFMEEELTKFKITPDEEESSGRTNLPVLDGSFHVSGIQALMRDMETLTNIKQIIIPLSMKPPYDVYIKPFKTLKAIEKRVNLVDEEIIATDEEAKLIGYQRQLAQAKQTEALEKMQELQEALGITELVQKIEEIEAMGGDVEAMAGKIKELGVES